MDVTECIRSDRATRNFADRTVDDESIELLVDNARRAGSGHNRQPWTFVAVRDSERRQTLAEFGEYTTPLRRAPVGIMVATDLSHSEMHRRINVLDCGRAVVLTLALIPPDGEGFEPRLSRR